MLDSSTEYLNLDGETLRFALELRYGLAENWDLQLEVPWLEHSGGNLDRLIDDWHDLWGMSDGGRSEYPGTCWITVMPPERRFSACRMTLGPG